MRGALAAVLFVGACFSKPEPLTGPSVDAPIADAPPPDSRPQIEANYMFTTSGVFPIGSTTISQADAACNTAAVAGGVPGQFLAWLSRPGSLAKDRINATNTRGWVRTDGKPFARTMSEIASGRIFYPPRIDENGSDLVARGDTTSVATGTDADLSPAADYCDPSTDQIRVGEFDAGGQAWTAAESLPCTAQTHFYCFGIGKQSDLPTITPAGKLAFVTSNPYALTTIGDADTACNTEGGAGSWVALIAPTGGTAKSRVTSTGPYFRPDGVMVSTDLQTFIAPISQTRSGAYVRASVWFGASNAISNGTGGNCAGWTGVGTTTHVGDSVHSDGALFSVGNIHDCVTPPHHLYCVQN